MRIATVYRKELLSHFVSPIAYVIMLVFLLVNGLTFYFYLKIFDGNFQLVISSQYGGISFWFLCVLVPPLLTMQCFAEEKRSGTYELLVTTGIGEACLVAGKFLAAWTFFLILWAAILPLFVLLDWVGDPDWGVIAAVQVGLVLLGALYTSLGVFASTLSQNQLVAASISMVGCLLTFFLSFFRSFFEVGDFALRYFNYFSPLHHFSADFTQGLLDYRYLIVYGSSTVFFLFLAVKSLERRRWW